jgi:hypothetical protein
VREGGGGAGGVIEGTPGGLKVGRGRGDGGGAGDTQGVGWLLQVVCFNCVNR